jgi:hypothetical protein
MPVVKIHHTNIYEIMRIYYSRSSMFNEIQRKLCCCGIWYFYSLRSLSPVMLL